VTYYRRRHLLILVSCSDVRRPTHPMASGIRRSNDNGLATPSPWRNCRRVTVVPSTLVVITATLVACLLIPYSMTPVTATTCDIEVGTGDDDDWRPPSTVEIVLQAQSVIYGHVRRTFPDSRFDYGHGTSVYTAEMDVYCTLKGRRLDRVINVSRAGSFIHLLNVLCIYLFVLGSQY